MKISNKTIVIWLMWVMAVIFFAWSAYWAPEPDSGPVTAPEFFLFVLGIAHLIGGIALIITSFADDNDWG